MREILFRGKRVDNGEWVYGTPILYTTTNRVVMCKEYEPNHNVIPETVGQYTGLNDKNGTRIFEGDIVEGRYKYKRGQKYYDEKIRGYIFYGGDASFFIQREGLFGIWLNNADIWLEVIGNIHDNPELLEVEA